MATSSNIPFGIQSVVPELQNVPSLRHQVQLGKGVAPSILRLSEESRLAMDIHLDTIGPDQCRFNYSIRDQQNALELFACLKLHMPTNEDRDVQLKYSIQKTDSRMIGGKGGKPHPWKQVTRFYQCQCRIDNTAGRWASKQRQIPWRNVGCMSWIKLVTTHFNDKEERMIAIDEISGIYDHSDECTIQIEMDRNPRLPLNSEMREYALSLLRKNVPLSLLRSECLAWAENRWPGLPGDKSSCFRLTAHDTSSLYRMISRERGVGQRTAAEENLDKWFRKDKPQPPSFLMTESCLHYQAHKSGETDRFEVILSTPEMQVAAWSFGHRKQVLMDLTFGFCSAHALLVILMAIDDSGSGIPICFMIFTARDSAKAVHADYDTSVLDRLLALFKKGMGINDLGEEFDIRIANTDNDARERAALTNNWKEVTLLLCIFHVWQAWRNGLNRYLCSIPKGETRSSVRQRLGKFLMQLLRDISVYKDAVAAYSEEVQYWKSCQCRQDKVSKSQAKGALAFLKYLNSYIGNEAFWQSWSPAGALRASQLLGVPVSNVARTNNHLESFNGRIKGKYFKPYQHSGRLPRIDVWALLIVTTVMPDFFKERHEKQKLQEHYAMLRLVRPLPGSDSGVDHSFESQASDSSSSSSSADEKLIDCNKLIQNWLVELNNESDIDNVSHILEDEDDEQDLQSTSSGCALVDLDYDENFDRDQRNSDLEVCPMSMDYDEESIHPGLVEFQFRGQGPDFSDEIISDSCAPSESSNSDGGQVPGQYEQSPIWDSACDPLSTDLLYMNDILQLKGGNSGDDLSGVDRNQVATAMIELHQAEDAMVHALRTLLHLTPGSLQQLTQYISPRIQDQLDSEEESIRSLNELESRESDTGVGDGFIPFTHALKEKRKPSYRIH